MRLEEYRPKSCLEVPAHDVPVARFPVIDFHTHWGKLVMGERYEDC